MRPLAMNKGVHNWSVYYHLVSIRRGDTYILNAVMNDFKKSEQSYDLELRTVFFTLITDWLEITVYW